MLLQAAELVNNNESVVEEYRWIISGHQSTDERIAERLQSLESFCRNIIKIKLAKYLKNEA